MNANLFDRAMAFASVGRLRLKARVGKDLVLRGRLWVHGGGRIVIGDRVVLDAFAAPIELHVPKGALLDIGDDVYVGGGSSIEAQMAITIGARCRLGAFVKLIDNNFHKASGDRVHRPPSVPIFVEDDVEIGARAILLPGVRVGRGSVITAGTVVTRRVPPGSIVSGVPAVVRPARVREPSAEVGTGSP